MLNSVCLSVCPSNTHVNPFNHTWLPFAKQLATLEQLLSRISLSKVSWQHVPMGSQNKLRIFALSAFIFFFSKLLILLSNKPDIFIISNLNSNQKKSCFPKKYSSISILYYWDTLDIRMLFSSAGIIIKQFLLTQMIRREEINPHLLVFLPN